MKIEERQSALIGYPELCRTRPINLPQGIHYNVSRETYDNIPALSATVIKKWLRLKDTPSVFKYWVDNRWDETPTESLVIGQALDCIRLDGLFSERYATVPAGAPRRPTKAQINAKKPSPETLGAIAWWDKFQSENVGKTLLTDAQFERVLGMNKALSNNEGLTGVFEHCKKAVLVGDINGWACKAELDLWNPNSLHIMDIKSAEDVGPQGFFRAIERFDYITQAVWYLTLANSLDVEKTVFSFIAVGSEAPYPVRVHSFDVNDIEHAIIHDTALRHIKEGLRSLTFALTEQDFKDDYDWHSIDFPAWAIANARNHAQ